MKTTKIEIMNILMIAMLSIVSCSKDSGEENNKGNENEIVNNNKKLPLLRLLLLL